MKIIKHRPIVKGKCNDCNGTIKAGVDTEFIITTNSKDLVLCSNCYDNLKNLLVLLNNIDDPKDAIYEI